MPTSMPAHVTPKVLRWARESVGYDVDAAAKKIGVSREKLERAEQGADLLTLREAEKAAAAYDRPLAALFLPDTPQEEPPEAEFRRLPDAPEPPWPPELIKLFRQVLERQDAAAEMYELIDEHPAWPAVAAEWGAADRARLAVASRQMLGVDFDTQRAWRDSSGYKQLRSWVDAVERLGVLVMQNGDVSIEVMRGFASPHDLVPAIVVNTQDDPRARAFSVVHELGHLWLAARGEPASLQDETWCNDFAGEVIMPSEWMKSQFAIVRATRDLFGAIDQLAFVFGVTPMAAAVRLRRLELISNREVTEIGARHRERVPGGTSAGGGDYYRGRIAGLGPSFTRLVLAALDSQALTYPQAAGLLGVKVNHFDTLREYIAERSAPE